MRRFSPQWEGSAPSERFCPFANPGLLLPAEFTVPTVTTNMTHGGEVTLVCNSYGGSHKPRVWWRNSVDGSLLGSGRLNTEKHKDYVNVTSIVTVNVTQSLNITCTVENPQGNVTSLPYFLDIPPLNEYYAEGRSHVSEAVIGATLPLLVLALLAVGLCLARKPLCVWRAGPKGNKEGTELPLQGRYPEVRRAGTGQVKQLMGGLQGPPDPTHCHWENWFLGLFK
eukprot:XP_017946861.1 PREDICTED: uncharacterized protein LOC101732704 isoform X1 [Xenopus tropicalis]